MLAVDLFIRNAAIGVFAVTILILLRDQHALKPVRWGVLLAINSICVLLVESQLGFQLPLAVQWLLMFLMAFNSMLIIWWFCRSLFDERFSLGWIDLAVAGLWVSLGLPALFQALDGRTFELDIPALIRSVMSVGILCHTIYVALSTRADDLIERRRRARVGFVLAIVVIAGVTIISELFLGYGTKPTFRPENTLKAFAYLGMATWGMLWLVQAKPGVPSPDPSSALVPAFSSHPSSLAQSDAVHRLCVRSGRGGDQFYDRAGLCVFHPGA